MSPKLASRLDRIGLSVSQALAYELSEFDQALWRDAVGGEVSHEALRRDVRSERLHLYSRAASADLIEDVLDPAVEAIEGALPYLRRVCAKPRRHLTVDETVRPAETVRRVGPAALRHIASHSEHWQSCRLDGLRPARLLAQVVEDDLQLYENRVVRSAIVRAGRRVRARLHELEEALGELECQMVGDEMDREYVDPRRLAILERLFPSGFLGAEGQRHEMLRGHVERLRILSSSLAVLLESQVARETLRSNPVASPLLPTNILTMDRDYRAVAELWRELDAVDAREKPHQMDNSPSALLPAYAAFAHVMLLQALDVLGYEAAGETALSRRSGVDGRYLGTNWTVELFPIGRTWPGGLRVRISRRWAYRPFRSGLSARDVDPARLPSRARLAPDGLEIELPFEDEDRNALAEACRSPERNRKDAWKNWAGSLSGKPLPDETRDLALLPFAGLLGEENGDLEHNLKELYPLIEEARGSIGAVSVALIHPHLPGILQADTETIRLMSGHGDALPETFARHYGEGRVSFVPLSPNGLNSLARLLRLIQSHTLAHEVREATVRVCPACGKERLAESDGRSICRDCGASWATTTCVVCTHQYPVVWPKRRRAVQDEVSVSPGAWIERLDMLAGTTAVGAFCESMAAPRAEHSLCPKCGACSRRSGFSDACARCRSSHGARHA